MTDGERGKGQSSTSSSEIHDGDLVLCELKPFPMWPAQVIPLDLSKLVLGLDKADVLKVQEDHRAKLRMNKKSTETFLVRFYGDGSWEFVQKGMMKLWCDSSRNDKTIEGAVKKLHRMKDESSKKLYLQAVSEITYCAYKHRVKPSQDKLTALRRDLARRRKETGVEIDLDLLDVRDHMKEGLESSKPKPKLTSDKKGQRPEQREHKKRANQNHRGGGKENKVTVKVKGCKRPHKAADDPVPAPPAKKKKSTLVGMMLQPAMEFWSKATKRAAPAGPPSQAPASDACSDEAGKVSPTAILDQELKAVAKRKKEQEDTKKRVLNALREKSKSTESDDAKVLAKLIKDVVEATG
ncbi:hypothetical protein HOP50_17g80080 [Chloropicon primus]|uniref:PWWP domain-containing protein n=1 Tax=Chloropicon primus TaxID=1764295 RepID=A0A5B8MXD8_9CHLO|nr:hypothetical protein A3770_17p79860 [Chloropicon primus]UPR04664.1 hypothetical protein HOP50_17g80080 [Chloropicon primus]|eukprot:QDZ25468.1 hypothetical protein A3770_17p79860 [Chloropicon primus]